MKAFSFRLEQALRWRETQLNIQKSKVAAVAGQLAAIENQCRQLRDELAAAANGVATLPTGGSLQSWAGFRDRANARIQDAEAQSQVVRRNLAAETSRLLEANRKLQLLENLKQHARTRWQHDFDKELAIFADEAFLGRIQSENRRARSSGG